MSHLRDPVPYSPRGSSLPDDDPLAIAYRSGPRLSRFNWWIGVIIVFAMFAVALVPILYTSLPREIDRWHMALAMERRLEGDLEGAVRSLTRVIEGSPDNEELLRQRAEWRLELRDLEAALADATRAIELNPKNAPGYWLRCQIYQRLGCLDETLADMDALADRPIYGGRGQSTLLNGRAYARAVAGRDLDTALDEVEQAIEMAPQAAALLDTRGYIQLLRGQTEDALTDMNLAVNLAERTHKLFTDALHTDRAGVLDLREFKLMVSRHAENVAVIRYHRALVYDEMGEMTKAEADRQRVRDLGFEPDENLF